MVLEDSTATPSDFTSDYTPDSDFDPYSTTNPSDQFIRLNLPSPPPIIGPLFGYTQAYCTAYINARIQTSVKLLGRPPTQDEATALAYWSAKMLSYAAWGRPLGLAAGCYQAYRTAATYRFPFVQPKAETFNPNFFSLLRFQLQGKQAQFMWHGLRTIAYGTFGIWTGGVLIGTYAATVAAVGEQRDPRLRDLLRAIRERVREAVPASPPGAPGNQQPGQRRDPTGQGTRSASELWKNHRTAIGANDAPLATTPGTYEDDASPSSGDAYDPYDGNGTAEQDRSLAMNKEYMLTDREMRKREARQRPNPRSSLTENTASTFSIEKVERQPRSFDDVDASPTGGEGTFMDSAYGSDSDSTATGSAWERIRQEAVSAPTSRPSRNAVRGSRIVRRPKQTPEERLASSATGQESQLDKDEAQRAFDERVERERRGGEF